MRSGLLIAVDEAAPGECLVCDAHAVRRREVTQLPQMRGRELLVAAACGGDVAAQQHRVDSEPAHQTELRLGPRKVVLQLLGTHALEVAERLVEVERETELGCTIPHSLR